MDPEEIAKPRPWDMGSLAKFILFIGPCSSILDYTTFLIMLALVAPFAGVWPDGLVRMFPLPTSVILLISGTMQNTLVFFHADQG